MDSLGNMMLVLVGRDFVTYNEKTDEFSSRYNLFTLPAGYKPVYVAQDPKGNYWAGCFEGLVKYNPRKKSLSYRDHNADNDPVIEAFKEHKVVIFAYLDKHDNFWITSWPLEGLRIRSYNLQTKQITNWQDTIGRSPCFRF